MHTTHIIRDWLVENRVWYLSYPVKSLDLNPIKYFWLKLKELLHRLYPELKIMGGGVEARKNKLVKAIYTTIAKINGWDQWDLLAKLIAFMPKRLVAIKLVQEK